MAHTPTMMNGVINRARARVKDIIGAVVMRNAAENGTKKALKWLVRNDEKFSVREIRLNRRALKFIHLYITSSSSSS